MSSHLFAFAGYGVLAHFAFATNTCRDLCMVSLTVELWCQRVCLASAETVAVEMHVCSLDAVATYLYPSDCLDGPKHWKHTLALVPATRLRRFPMACFVSIPLFRASWDSTMGELWHCVLPYGLWMVTSWRYHFGLGRVS